MKNMKKCQLIVWIQSENKNIYLNMVKQSYSYKFENKSTEGTVVVENKDEIVKYLPSP